MTDQTAASGEPQHKVRAVADRMGVRDDTIYGLLRDGELRGVRVGRLWRIPESAVIEFLERGGSARRDG